MSNFMQLPVHREQNANQDEAASYGVSPLTRPLTIDRSMNSIKLVAVLLMVAGVLMLAYGGFSYTKENTAVKVGPIELSVKEKETVNFPVWAGVGAIVVGGLLLVFGGKR